MKILDAESCRDESTGLYDRVGFTEIADIQIESAYRNHSPLTVLYLDLDHFQSVAYEPRNMLLLMFVADLLDHLRKADLVARWGENEFVILLPNTGMEAGVHMLENLRNKLNSELTKYESRVVANIGGITYLTPPYDGDALAHQLDELFRSSVRDFKTLQGRRTDTLSVC